MFKGLKNLFGSGSKENANEEQLPVPRHLKDIFQPTDTGNTEYKVTGAIICTCGSNHFAIELAGDDSRYAKDHFVKPIDINGNYLLVVQASCINCRKEYLIFDNYAHGWDGFVGEEGAATLSRPATHTWKCNKCGHADHSMSITIRSAGEKHFIEETDGAFQPDDWKEGFGSIDIDISCHSCNYSNKGWVSCETS